MSKSPIHETRPTVSSPSAKPGESPDVTADRDRAGPDRRADRGALAESHRPDNAVQRTVPKRDGDNSGGESTASELDSSDQGHVHTPRPSDHQGGH